MMQCYFSTIWRLPTEYEWEYAATQAGKTIFPWGNDVPSVEQSIQESFLPVGFPRFDQLPTNPRVYGLCSNVAEWTCSQVYTYLGSNLVPHFETPASLKQHRVVRGGNEFVIFDGNPVISTKNRDPHTRIPVHRSESHSGLGVRFVRSSRPRLEPNDFSSIINIRQEKNEP
jgi:eukaryotic-like serine/threonine-protein kinase